MPSRLLVIIIFVLIQLYLKGMKSLDNKGMAKSLEKSCSCGASGHFDFLKSSGTFGMQGRKT